MFYRLLLILTISIFGAVETQSQIEIAKLEPRISVERELGGGQKHIYQFFMNVGQYANVIVSQRGLDAKVRLIGIDEKLIAEFDSDFRLQGDETVELIAGTSGNYKVEVESKNKPDSVGRYEIRLAELRTATDQDRSLEQAREVTREGRKLLESHNPEEAAPLAEKALTIRKELLGSDHPEVANSIQMLANIAYDAEDFNKAQMLFDQALGLREKLLAPDDPDLAESFRGLANAYHMQGKYTEATALYYRALEIKEQAFGNDHPEVGRLLNTIAKHYNYIHDNVHAELLLQRALTIAEKNYGTNHPEYAKALSGLATNYKDLGDYGKADLMFRQALEIFEKTYGKDAPQTASTLINYGILYIHIKEYDKAESFFERVLNYLNTKEKDDFALSIVLHNLGYVYLGKGENEKAEAVFQQALTIREKMFGTEHPRYALCLRDLADLYRAEADYVKAEPLYLRALDILEKKYGPDHLDLVDPLQGLAIVYEAIGDIDRSIAYQMRANAVTNHNLTYNLMLGSERQKLIYLDSLSEQTDQTLSLQMNYADNNSDAKTLAVNTVLQRKGRILDWMIDSLAILRDRLSITDKNEIDQLNKTNSQLANLVLNGPQKTSVADHQKRIRVLEEQREKLENDISKLSSGFYQSQSSIDVAKIQAVIPHSSALIEFAIYRPFDPKLPEKMAFSDAHYVAYVIRNNEVLWKDLGEVKTIDKEINKFRESLRNYSRKDVKQLARAVDKRIMQPIRPLLGDAIQLFISPDGELNLIPFDALVDEHQNFLIERYSCTYLTSGRDLLRLQVERDSKTDPVVFADPIFGEPESTVPATLNGLDSSKSVTAKRNNVTTASDLSQVYFAPLAGTASEAQAIKSLFNQSKVLIGKQATESSVKQVNAPRILHIATHGFFLLDTPSASEMIGPNRSINTNIKIENPLLRSGLAFTGANLHTTKGDDGILTALEASGLNLWGTKLVTLSACDTGLGEVKNGEGVYGLRRAFVLAGTETLVMSLWSVNDYVTREMMTNYYKGLRNGLGRGEALRQVQLKMLKDKRRQHPYYWASFIQSGEWANLEGKR
jgi:CHAT domain-containing protein/Tfp pilus assembly protein PilF